MTINQMTIGKILDELILSKGAYVNAKIKYTNFANEKCATKKSH